MDRQSDSASMFLATGSYKHDKNYVEVLKMNEDTGLSCVLTIEEKYPPTKLMWIPKGALGLQS
jgi:hypothetical protein